MPIRNELTSQSTRWKGNRENMILAGYLADAFPDRLNLNGAFRELLTLHDPAQYRLVPPDSPIFFLAFS